MVEATAPTIEAAAAMTEAVNLRARFQKPETAGIKRKEPENKGF
jgi:hypothetical protein